MMLASPNGAKRIFTSGGRYEALLNSLDTRQTGFNCQSSVKGWSSIMELCGCQNAEIAEGD